MKEMFLPRPGITFAQHDGRVEGIEMTADKNNVESEGAKPRDHAHPPYHFLKQAHRDWRVWAVVALMLCPLRAVSAAEDLLGVW